MLLTGSSDRKIRTSTWRSSFFSCERGLNEIQEDERSVEHPRGFSGAVFLHISLVAPLASLVLNLT